MAFIYDLTDTWNAGGTTFNAIKMNVTDSASAAASKLVTLQVGGSERFGVRKDGQGYFAGNVGIGTSVAGSYGRNIHLHDPATTSVSLKLSHTGTGTGAADGLEFIMSGVNGFLQNREAGFLSFATSNTERMRITSGGDVGIGTTTPSAKLSVAGRADFGVSTDALVYLTNAANAVRGFLDVGTSDFTIGASGGGVPLIFSTSATERMRIDSSGNVGIGTSSPTARFHVQTDTNKYIQIKNAVHSGYAAPVAALTFSRSDGNSDGSALFGDNTNLVSSARGAIAFATGGIGTYSGTTERMRIDSSGNVGIGTTTPSVSLDVVGGIRARGGAPGSGGASNNGYAFNGAGDTDSGMFSSADGQVEFYTNNSERVRIDSAGRVAIGTTSPNAAAQLDVTSTTRAFLPPRMTTAQRDAIASPPDGSVLYNSTTNKLQVRAAGSWVDLH